MTLNEAVVAYFNVQSQHFPGGIAKSYEKNQTV
jgi:hypothetical protein